MTAKQAQIARTLSSVAKANEQARQAELARKAYELRVAGRSWWEIAEELNLTEAAASTLVHERLRQVASLVDEGSRREMLATELDRLDRLQAAVWTKAMDGDPKSVSAALAVIDRRAKFLGLETDTATTVTANTIVVPGPTADYVAALRSVHAARNAEDAS